MVREIMLWGSRVTGRMDGRLDGWTDGWTDGRQDGWTDWNSGLLLSFLVFSFYWWMPMSCVCKTQGEGEGSVSSDMFAYPHGNALKKALLGRVSGKPACHTNTNTDGAQQTRRCNKHGHGLAPIGERLRRRASPRRNGTNGWEWKGHPGGQSQAGYPWERTMA
ncbi:hypothetical protein M440DRAFT_247930 [Trichoderma longibrachiatum ATCC 18648]|uniref:Uncharacterized protein n=1 Tax=Trichoderma longibrachiatum ATCC 18648 TaxID=983965 RepID=A0A2T4CDX3_TRILO|nr:hypothetical protein M440DRAFT_247930 [Trichoderma longibrachiatum ATCC 18648]